MFTKKMNSGSFKNVIYKMYLEIIYLIYMYKMDLALKNLERLYGIKPNQTKLYIFIMYV